MCFQFNPTGCPTEILGLDYSDTIADITDRFLMKVIYLGQTPLTAYVSDKYFWPCYGFFTRYGEAPLYCFSLSLFTAEHATKRAVKRNSRRF